MLPLIIAGVLVVVVLVVGLMVMQSTSKKTGTTGQQTSVTPTAGMQKGKPVGKFPQVTVSNWTIPASIAVQSPASARIYDFKQPVGASDFRQMASKFFTVNEVNENAKRMVSYSTQVGASMVYMQKESGAFVFTADRGVDLPASASATPETMTAYTQALMGDTTLKLTAEYSKSNDQGTRFYEFHRDWAAVGMPIFNLFGLFNMPATTKLGSLTFGKPAGLGPNAAYVNTTDNTDGMDRANEFNTVTVGVKEGKVKSVSSTIRPFALTGGSQPTMSYAQAVTKLKANEYSYIYTSPVGTGAVDRDKLYPQNRAAITSATVSDATIAYLEELPANSQKQMIPYYIFRGTGQLQNGYEVSFLAAVPAVNTKVLGATTTNTALMAQNGQDKVPVGNESSQQQGTLNFEEQGGTLPGSTPLADGLPVLTCNPPPDPSQLTDPQQDVSGIVYGRAPRDGNRDMEWYVVPETDWDVNKLQEAATIVYNAATNSAVEADAERARRLQKMVEDFEEQGAGCPVRVTGSSPTVFAYSETPATMIVSPSNVLYTAPALGNGSWTAQVNGNSVTVDGRTSDYLYYEYRHVSFTRPTAGWNVAKSDLNAAASRLATALGLTKTESARLSFELNHAATDVNASTLFVGPVSQSELNAKVPLNVTGTSTVERVHFYVGKAQGSVSAAHLSPVTRTSSYVLELGASAQ